MKAQSIVCGSGISGLLSALLLSDNENGENVILIEKGNELGGLLKSFDYGVHGHFDYGMHNMLETGLKELDSLLFNLLPEIEWQILEGSHRDLAGVFVNGKLQVNTPYIDLRNLNPIRYEKCLKDFLVHSKKINLPDSLSKKDWTHAEEFFTERFGREISENVFEPALQKIYGKHPSELDYMATLFTPMNRVTLFELDKLEILFKANPSLRSLIAYTDQRKLPLEFSSGRRAYYPKKYGMYRLVEAIRKQLEARGVQILTETEIRSIEHSSGKIESVEVLCKDRSFKISNLQNFVWTAGMPLLAKLLGLASDFGRPDKAKKTIVVNFLVNQKPDMEDLYYFFCYEENTSTFRLTNFSNYCEGAFRNGGFPISMELLIDTEKSESEYIRIAKNELERFNVLKSGTEFIFAKAEALESGFPMPSKKNIQILDLIRESIHSIQIKNLVLLGVLSEKNLFFQTDVLIDTYKKFR